MQNKFPHIAVKVTDQDFGLPNDGIATWAIKRLLRADTYSPAMIRGESYEDCIEKVRVEVEAHGGVWNIFSPEAVVRPLDHPTHPFSIHRIV